MAEEASQGTEDIQTIYANALAAREASEKADDLHCECFHSTYALLNY